VLPQYSYDLFLIHMSILAHARLPLSSDSGLVNRPATTKRPNEPAGMGAAVLAGGGDRERKPASNPDSAQPLERNVRLRIGQRCTNGFALGWAFPFVVLVGHQYRKFRWIRQRAQEFPRRGNFTLGKTIHQPMQFFACRHVTLLFNPIRWLFAYPESRPSFEVLSCIGGIDRHSLLC
jgi:hypothetical protein